jgi:hypothetical protein
MSANLDSGISRRRFLLSTSMTATVGETGLKDGCEGLTHNEMIYIIL